MITKTAVGFGQLVGAALNFGIPAWSFMSGEDSAGGAIGDAVGGTVGYGLGTNLVNTWSKGKAGNILKLVGGLAGGMAGGMLGNSVGDSMWSYRRKPEPKPQIPNAYRQPVSNYQYSGYPMQKVSSFFNRPKKLGLTKLLLAEDADLLEKENLPAFLLASGIGGAFGSYIGNKSFNKKIKLTNNYN